MQSLVFRLVEWVWSEDVGEDADTEPRWKNGYMRSYRFKVAREGCNDGRAAFGRLDQYERSNKDGVAVIEVSAIPLDTTLFIPICQPFPQLPKVSTRMYHVAHHVIPSLDTRVVWIS